MPRPQALKPDQIQDLAQAVAGYAIDPEWIDRALCPQTDPEAFFPEVGDNPLAAQRVCRRCPVSLDCLTYALTHDVGAHGVWAGTTPQQRVSIAKALDRLAPGTALTRSRIKAERDARIVHLSNSGLSVTEVAEQVGVNERTVHRVTAAHRALLDAEQQAG